MGQWPRARHGGGDVHLDGLWRGGGATGSVSQCRGVVLLLALLERPAVCLTPCRTDCVLHVGMLLPRASYVGTPPSRARQVQHFGSRVTLFYTTSIPRFKIYIFLENETK
jgi:hypothetical protein